MIKIDNPKQMGILATQACFYMKNLGYKITANAFYDPQKRRLDPVAALWFNNVMVSKEKAEPFLAGFLNISFEMKSQEDIEYYKSGKLVRRKFIG